MADDSSVPAGWHSIKDAAQIAHLTVDEARRRAKLLKPMIQFTPVGLRPKSTDELTVPGSALKRNQGGRIIVNNTVVEAWREAEEHAQHLQDAGWKTIEQVAADLGEDVATVSKRIAKLK